MGEEEIELKAASTSNPASLGGAIVKNIEEGKKVYIIAVGAGAVNQTVKSLAIAQGYAAPQGLVLSNRVGFTDVEIEGEEKTAMKFNVLVD